MILALRCRSSGRRSFLRRARPPGRSSSRTSHASSTSESMREVSTRSPPRSNELSGLIAAVASAMALMAGPGRIGGERLDSAVRRLRCLFAQKHPISTRKSSRSRSKVVDPADCPRRSAPPDLRSAIVFGATILQPQNAHPTEWPSGAIVPQLLPWERMV